MTRLTIVKLSERRYMVLAVQEPEAWRQFAVTQSQPIGMGLMYCRPEVVLKSGSWELAVSAAEAWAIKHKAFVHFDSYLAMEAQRKLEIEAVTRALQLKRKGAE